MALVAYGCIEQQSNGRWVCRRSSIIEGRFGPVEVVAGQVFALHSSFAGFDDFPGHMTSIARDEPWRPLHEWAEEN